MADLNKLKPTHLIPEGATAEDLKAQVAATQAAVTAPEDERKARMRERSYTFPFTFTDANGKVYEGTFTNVVPDIRTRLSIGTLRAQITGGLDFAALDPLTRDLALHVAHLTYSLDEKARPTWAANLLGLFNHQLLRALWEEVALHEAMFLGL